MAVYQVSIVFEAVDDDRATRVAKKLSNKVVEMQEEGVIDNAKIAFTKFEKEEDAGK